jgi:hypothetical protein
MKIIYYFTVIFFSIFLITACNSNKKQPLEEQKKQINEAYNKIDELQEKAAQDSDYAKSKEYSQQMEKANIELAKKTSNISEIDKLLIEYETELKALEVYSKKLLKQPKLSEDKKFTDEMLMKGNKVRELYQKLSTSTLSAKQKKKFQELSYMK